MQLDVLPRLGLPCGRTHMTVRRTHANTGAASLPLALDAARRGGSFDDGDTALLAGFGGSMSGTALLRWDGATATR